MEAQLSSKGLGKLSSDEESLFLKVKDDLPSQ